VSKLLKTGRKVKKERRTLCAEISLFSHTREVNPAPFSHTREVNPGIHHPMCTTGIHHPMCTTGIPTYQQCVPGHTHLPTVCTRAYTTLMDVPGHTPPSWMYPGIPHIPERLTRASLTYPRG